jgi:hypothetical protein
MQTLFDCMKKSKKSVNQLLMFFSFLLIGGAVGYFVGKFVLKGSPAIPSSVLLAMLLLFIPAFLVVIAVHELGHVTAGLLMDFEFKSITVGPLMWEKEQGRLKFKWNKNVNTAGGLALCLPTGSHNLARRFAFYAAGGPLASVILAVTGFVLIRYIFSTDADSGTAVLITKWFVKEIAFLSAVIGMVTLIPLHTGGFSSDGARIINLLKGGDTSRFELLILKIFGAATGGIRPAMYNMDELNEAQELAVKLKAPFGVYIHSFFHQAAFDKGDFDTAEMYLKRYIDQADDVPDGVRGMVWLDAAFFYAFVRKDLTQAEYFFKQYKPAAMIPKAQVSATEAAIAILQNEWDTASSAIDSAEMELICMIDKGNAVALKEKLSEMRETVLASSQAKINEVHLKTVN